MKNIKTKIKIKIIDKIFIKFLNPNQLKIIQNLHLFKILMIKNLFQFYRDNKGLEIIVKKFQNKNQLNINPNVLFKVLKSKNFCIFRIFSNNQVMMSIKILLMINNMINFNLFGKEIATQL